MPTDDRKRLRFAQNSFIDVERVGGLIVAGTFDSVLGARVIWSEVAIGQLVRCYPPLPPISARFSSERQPDCINLPILESMSVLS